MSNIAAEDRKLLINIPKNNFISSYSIASSIVDSAVNSHDGLWTFIKACQDHINGKKPVPPESLTKKGLGWVYNFNYGKARAKIEKATAENISKLSAAIALGYATLRAVEDEDLEDPILSFLAEDEKRAIVASAIGYALTTTLTKENRLSSWMNDVEYPSYAFGYAAVIFEEFDWMPTPVHPLNIAFRPDTKPGDIKTWILFDVIDADELYDRWAEAYNESVQEKHDESGNTQRIASNGWNLEGLEAVLLSAFKGKLRDNKTPESWKEVIPYLMDNCSEIINNTESVPIAKIYHREIDGTLSEVYIPYSAAAVKPDSTKIEDSSNVLSHILYSKNKGIFKQSEKIIIVRDSGFATENGSIQEMRGMSQYAVEDSIRYNRQRNSLNNKSMLAGAPYFESPSGQSIEKFKLVVSQGFIMLPQSHRMLEKQPTFDLSSHINILKFEEGEFNRDTQQYDASIQGRLTSRPNKGEVQQVTREVEFTDNAKNNIKFRDYAEVFFNVLKRIGSVRTKEGDPGYPGKQRLYKTIKKNLSWLVKTDEDVEKILSTIDSYVIEPVVANIETITIAIQMAETPFARNRLKRMLLIAKGMPIEEVNLSVPLMADRFTSMQDARIAAFENDMFFTTNEIVLSETDDHIVHLTSHLAKCERVIKAVQESALDPVQAFKYLENILLHCIQHNEMLGRHPILNQKAQEFGAKIAEIMQIKNNIKSAAEQILMRKQQEAQKLQMDPEKEARIATQNIEAQTNIQRKDWLAERRTEQRDKQIDQSHEARMREIELKHEEKINSPQ